MIDLHTHSNKSDGELSPSALMETAYKCGVRTISLTDHDNVSGNAEAMKKCKELGMKFITGIEISADEFRDLHILGYNIDINNTELLEKCEIFAESRRGRVTEMINLLARNNIFITEDDVVKQSKDGIIARPHFAGAMIEKGYVSTTEEAFEKYLATPEFHKIKRYKAPFKEAIELIHNAGGLAVMAHPFQIEKSERQFNFDSFVAELVKNGLDGMECYYSRHTPEMFERYLKIAEKYNLCVSIGSDYHGIHIKEKIHLGTGDNNSLISLQNIVPFKDNKRNILNYI